MSIQTPRVAVIGAGPAGLMAADVLSQAALQVDVYDAMPSAGRKFLMAGKGGMNISHSEALSAFLSRYGAAEAALTPILKAFPADAVRHWMAELGIASFVGTSGRIFPMEMKAAPLLRAWLHRLRSDGVRFHMRHRWLGWSERRALRFNNRDGLCEIQADAVVLALGGGSWPQLGSNGQWLPLLAQHGIAIAPLQASNCGFEIAWSDLFRGRYLGQPIKNIVLHCADGQDKHHRQAGELVVSDYGLEGGAIYALSAQLREHISACGSALLYLDLLPGRSEQQLEARLREPRGKNSLSNHLRKRLGIDGVKCGLLYEVLSQQQRDDPQQLANALKRLPIRLLAARPLQEAISTAGGICLAELNQNLMLDKLPGIFCSGEMLDWEAPTGGYLLTACLATGRAAGFGVLDWLQPKNPDTD